MASLAYDRAIRALAEQIADQLAALAESPPAPPEDPPYRPPALAPRNEALDTYDPERERRRILRGWGIPR